MAPGIYRAVLVPLAAASVGAAGLAGLAVAGMMAAAWRLLRRHTALVTAEVHARLLPLMIDKGVTTFGAARALSAQARRIRAQQHAAGWGGE